MTNWTAQREDISNGLRVSLLRASRPAPFTDVLLALRDDPVFREWFNELLADVPFAELRWETPGVTTATSSRAFEFVVLDAPGLAREPEPEAFAEHFQTAPDAAAVAFTNLRGDATLIAPTPLTEWTAYGHLAAFVRAAPGPQRDALWKLVAEVTLRRLGTKPVWLSTAGAGVSWLHVRLDDRPKYYGHSAYRSVQGT